MQTNIEAGAHNTSTPTRLVWVDLEMTGLDVAQHRIVEVAVIVTDFEFNELAHYEAVVHQSEEVLAASSDFSLKTHEENGLYERVRSSTITDDEAQHAIRKLLEQYVPLDGVYLAGNSIRADRRFIDEYWPRVAALLHYRMLDVSSFKLWWLGTGNPEYKKGESHRALDDIRESIAELKFYLQEFRK